VQDTGGESIGPDEYGVEIEVNAGVTVVAVVEQLVRLKRARTVSPRLNVEPLFVAVSVRHGPLTPVGVPPPPPVPPRASAWVGAIAAAAAAMTRACLVVRSMGTAFLGLGELGVPALSRSAPRRP
jgi:hypothetical protein